MIISATGNKHKIQRWRDAVPFTDVFVFLDLKVCSLVLHALKENNLSQEVCVTFFVSFLTAVLIGTCFNPHAFYLINFHIARVIILCLLHVRCI